jgi:hypothetical protein
LNEGSRQPALAAHAAIVGRALSISQTVESLLRVTRCLGYDMAGFLNLSLGNGVFGWLRTADCWQTGVAAICNLEGLARVKWSVRIGVGLIMWTLPL